MFYDKVKKLCSEKGISITSLALELGFSRSAPSSWRSMKNPPRALTVKKIAEYFSVPQEFLTDTEPTLRERLSLDHDAQAEEMIRLFKQLTVMDKAKVLIFTNDLIKTTKET